MIVIGGGIVGLSVCRELLLNKQKVILLEKEECLGSSPATSGNSGLGCTGYDAPKDSLERRLLRRAIELHPNLYRSFGLSSDHISKCGSLVVAWTQSEYDKLSLILQENHEIGDDEVQLLTKEESLEAEPSLSEDVCGALWIPRESISEPWLVAMGYAQSCREHGAAIHLNEEVVEVVDAHFVNEQWNVVTSHEHVFTAPVVINCGGLYGDILEALRTKHGSKKEDKDGFEIRPRKGQFVVLDGTDIDLQCIIEPVPSLRTKGVIIWKTLYGNIVIGPTADEQTSREDTSNDQETIEMLKGFGERRIRGLSECKVVGTYSGIRPSTQHRDYQIYSHEEQQWITVGGIRSTGLTASSAIGEYVANLYLEMVGHPGAVSKEEEEDVRVVPPYKPAPLKYAEDVIANQEVPTLQELSRDFKQRHNGKVTLYGEEHRVTHPIAYLGMKTM